MRLLRVVFLAGLALAARPAGAGRVELVGGELTLGLGSLPVLRLPVAPTSVLVSHEGKFRLPAKLVAETRAALPRSLFTGVPQLSGFSILSVLNAPLDFEGEAGLGVGPLTGVMILDVLQLVSLSLPLGVVGSPGASAPCHCPGIIITVIGQGWVAGTASVTGLQPGPPFSASPTAVFHGSDARSADHGGSLVLVSPFKAVTNVIGTQAGFAILELAFAPEPGPAALLAAAAAVVLGLGWRRRAQAASSPNWSS